jgi:hypothetical protein
MKAADIVQKIQKSDPDLLKDIREERANALVAKVLREMRLAVQRAQGGGVTFPGFGAIRIKKVVKEADGRRLVQTQLRLKLAGDLARMVKRRGRRPAAPKRVG